LREGWEVTKESSYEEMLPAYKLSAAKNDYVYSITANADEICDFVN